MPFINNHWKKAAEAIKHGELAVIPTDTLYGIVASARDHLAVARLYRVRFRNPSKPCVILCASVSDIATLGINIDDSTKNILKQIWPNQASVILPSPNKKFSYLHRNSGSIAFRIPKNKNLRAFLKVTGPLLAPSANLEGKPPAQTIKEAVKYFGDQIAVYVSGKVATKPSTLITTKNGKIKILRQGAWRVPKNL